MENKNELPIFVEILPNVKSMTVNVGLARNKEESTHEFGLYPLKLIFESKTPSNKTISKTKTFSTSKIEIPLTQTVETSEHPIITNSDEGIDIKLKLRTFVRKRPPKKDISISETYQAPFNSTKISSLKNILCGYCKKSLIKKNTLKKVLDMPSEHWIELVDCWMCHQESYEHAKIGDIIAQENIGLVSNNYFLLHPNNVEENSFEVDDEELHKIDWTKGLSKKWISINCTRCFASIGDGYYCKSKDEEEKDELILLAVKLNKYMTLIEMGDDADANKKESVLQKYKFTAFLAIDFLEATKVHATYRFIIKGKNFKQPYLLIWLFGWDSKIMTNALEGCNPFKIFSRNVEEDCSVVKNDLEICDVMKILYIDCTIINQDTDDKSAKLLEQWNKDNTVEHFIYQDVICLELLLLLRKSTSCLPTSKKYMNEFLVGFMDMNG